MNQPRRSAGTPDGGEFAPKTHSEVDLGFDLHGNVASHDLRARRRLIEHRFDDILGPDDLCGILEADRGKFPDDLELPAHRLAAFISHHPEDVIDPAAVVAFARTDDGGDFDGEVARARDEGLRSEARSFLADDADLGSWDTEVGIQDRQLAFNAVGALVRLDVSKYELNDRSIGPSVDVEDIDDRIREARQADPDRIVHMGQSSNGHGAEHARVTVELHDFEEEQVAKALAARSLRLTPREAKVLVGRWVDDPRTGGRMDDRTHRRVSRAVAETLPGTAGRTLSVAGEVRARVEEDFRGLVEFTDSDDHAQAHFESVAIPNDYFHAR